MRPSWLDATYFDPIAMAPPRATKIADYSKQQLATIMRIWSASAIGRYYRDPAVEFLQAGNRDLGKPAAAGYYIVPHCGPDCCQAFGGVSTTDLGPFSTRTKARKWSRTYLTEPAGIAR